MARRLLGLLENVLTAGHTPTETLAAAERLAVDRSRAPMPRELRLEAPDGIPLAAVAAGPPDSDSATVLIGPCGLPTTVLERWFGPLGESGLVAACVTRGFAAADLELPDCSMSLEAQAGDVLALMDHLQIERAHVMSICGGSVVALQLALLAPERVGSLSLWHGDFNVGDDRYSTRYQQDLRWLVTEGARSKEHAAALYPLVSGPEFIERVREDLAHLVLFPYATSELLYRYARANGAIMLADVRQMARRVTRPAWVVTSDVDDIAHPMGSRIVASLLPAAQLIETDGDHITCLDASIEARSIAARIIRDAASC